MKRISMLLLLASGTNLKILERCPSEKNKYVSIGGTIFFTGLFAALASAYALFTVFDNYFVSISLGVVWGIMIFNLDRFIVSSMRKEERLWRELLTAFPRIILAVVISLVIAKPFELKIFSKEIEPQLVVMEQQVYAEQEAEARRRFDPIIDKFKQDIERLNNEVTEKVHQRNELLRIAQEEADGTGGSKVKNLGPIYQLKKTNADQAEAELNELTRVNKARVASLESSMMDSQNEMTKTIKGIEHTKLNGPAARMHALTILTKESSAMWWANVFIIALFLLVEITPVLVKLFSGKGPYDSILHASEHEFRCRELESIAIVSSEAKNRADVLRTTEQEYLTRKLDAELS